MGKKYPGSTGGEIFNYYGDDVNKNVASGAYSTAVGYNCKATGNYSFAEGLGCRADGLNSFAGGYLNQNSGAYSFVYGRSNQTGSVATNSVNIGMNNTCIGTGSVILGVNNAIGQDGTYGVTIGVGNMGKNYYGIMIGTDNNSSTFSGARLIGDRLNASGADQFIFGRCNANPTLANANFIFGCGTNNTNRANFLEASRNSCKICNNLQLATDATEVNAIVPPSDPNNVTADDQTLATKAYVDGHTLGITVKRSEVLVSGQSELITPGAYLPLETTFNITIPSWATTLVLGLNRVVNGGDYFTYLTIDLSTSRRYSGSLEDTSDIIHYDVSQQAVGTLINDLSVVSVTAEGTSNI